MCAIAYFEDMKKTATLSVRLTEEEKSEFVAIAEADNRPPGQLAAIIIRQWLAEQRKKKGAIRRPLDREQM